jgi:hypothetical protein
VSTLSTIERLRAMGRENWLTILVIALLVIGYLSLRTQPSDVGTADEFLASLSAGQPTVIAFYNNV